MSSVSNALIQRSTQLTPARVVLQYLVFILVALVVLTFLLIFCWVEYACVHVFTTLAAVEDPNPTTSILLAEEDSDDLEVAATRNAEPITSGLRSTMKYLCARGGIWSCFRGFRVYLTLKSSDLGVKIVVHSMISIPIHYFVGAILANFISGMLLATWHMAWVHLVIADKSSRGNYRRMLSLQHWRRIAPAAALYNFVWLAIFSLARAFSIPPVWVVGWAAIDLFGNPRDTELLRSLLISILLGIVSRLISVPAEVIFVRVAASMLPQEQQPIVPLDPVFGNKANPDIPDGRGNLGLIDAWTTFGWPARIRYMKLLLKALAIELVLPALAMIGIGILALIAVK